MDFVNILSAAGQIACSFDARRVSFSGEGSDLVSDIDRAISAYVFEELTKSGFLSSKRLLLDEERAKGVHPKDLEKADEIVVIDPIDGSGAAVDGRPEFCVQMAHYIRHNGQLRARWSGFYRPRTLEMCVFGPAGVSYTSYHGVPGLHNERVGKDCVSGGVPRLMLLDYRFNERFDWQARSPMVHMNPSGFNMGDVALGRGVGFVFEYKPWDVCLLPLAGALGCQAYFLHIKDGRFEAHPADPMVFAPFDFFFDEDQQVFGKIKLPLLVCRPKHQAFILDNLRPRQ